MQAKLILASGAKKGMEIKISKEKFIIGRAEDCNLRVRSDAVSRHHCEFTLGDTGLLVTDCDSRNGTLVNDNPIEGTQELKTGDRVKVGPLDFEVQIDHSFGGDKKPKVTGIKEAAKRTVSSKPGDDDISSWLEEADQQEKTRRVSDPGTRQFKVPKVAPPPEDETKVEEKPKRPQVKPKEPEKQKDSTEAAEEMLKKLFGDNSSK